MRAPYKSEDEHKALMEFAATRRDATKYRLLLTLSFRLGLRPIELSQLASDQFRGDELRIRIGHTKGKGGRSLPINQEIRDALAAHMGEREGRVFLNNRGNAMTPKGISDAFRRFYREAGIEGSCYSGRRTLLTDLNDRNVSILTIQAVAGHRSPQTTMSYISVGPRQMAAALFG